MESQSCLCRQRSPLPNGDLGPYQLSWLEKNVEPFARAWKSVQASDLWAAKIRAQVGLHDFTGKE